MSGPEEDDAWERQRSQWGGRIPENDNGNDDDDIPEPESDTRH